MSLIRLFFCFQCFISVSHCIQAQNVSDSSFVQKEVSLKVSKGSIHGSYTVPVKFTSGKAVLIISGSGPTDRNGNSILLPKNNDCFLKMAHQLAEKGIAALRFDKRGVGASKNSMTREEDLTIDTLIDDVIRWIDLLKKEKGVHEITVAGHSEGSLLGMIASQRHADKYISISGAGFPADQIILKQFSAMPGIKDSVLQKMQSLFDSLHQGLLVKKFPLYLMSIFRPSIQPYMISWIKYDPAKEIAKLNIPILILQGDNDFQVSVDDANKLHRGNPNSKLVIVTDMTHTLRTCRSKDKNENMKTYQDALMPLAEECMQEIIGFINQ